MRAFTGRRASIVGTLACLLAAGLPGTARADADTPYAGSVVSTYADAGTLVGWGSAGSLSVPASLQGVPVASISMGSGWALASTLTGEIVTWGADSAIAPVLPRSVNPATLAQLAASGTSAAAAVTWDGHVMTWLGSSSPADHAWLDGNALDNVASVALGQQQPYGVALAKDGTVMTWGVDTGNGNVISAVPGALTDVSQVAACDDTGLALTADGGVHGWGSNADGLVIGAPVEDATNPVVQIGCASDTGVGLRKDGSIIEWGNISGVNAVPATLAAAIAGGAKVTSIEASGEGIVARTPNALWTWGGPTLVATPVPQELTGRAISKLAPGSDGVYALTPAILPVYKPIITGTPAPGKTLTAEYGHMFSGNTVESGQWYRDGVPIDGSASLDGFRAVYRVEAVDVGSILTFRRFAVDPGNPAAAPVVSESEPIVVGRAASTLNLIIPPGRYGRATPMTVTATSPAGVSGPVTVSVDGTDAGTATLVGGSATLALSATLAAGPHVIGATYRGNSASGGATGWNTLTVAKATSTAKVKLPKKAKHGKTVRTVVTVHPSGGRATGVVTVKIGKSKAYGSVVNGRAVVKVKAPAKTGRQKVVVIYGGDDNVQGGRAHAKLTVK